jgi:hypothetical protein
LTHEYDIYAGRMIKKITTIIRQSVAVLGNDSAPVRALTQLVTEHNPISNFKPTTAPLVTLYKYIICRYIDE